jgi:Helix-turn-helix domain of resolvase.
VEESGTDDDVRKGLTPEQWKALLLDFQGGMSRSEIADTLGIGRTTLYRWLAKPEYSAAMDEMVEELRGQVLKTAGQVAHEALEVARRGVKRIGEEMQTAETMHDVATGTRAAMDVYKTTAAQTGVAETQRLEHAGEVAAMGAEEVAEALARRMRSGCDAPSDEE